jgi:hypothetical protein
VPLKEGTRSQACAGLEAVGATAGCAQRCMLLRSYIWV